MSLSLSCAGQADSVTSTVAKQKMFNQMAIRLIMISLENRLFKETRKPQCNIYCCQSQIRVGEELVCREQSAEKDPGAERVRIVSNRVKGFFHTLRFINYRVSCREPNRKNQHSQLKSGLERGPKPYQVLERGHKPGTILIQTKVKNGSLGGKAQEKATGCIIQEEC
ncbi:hypothetical protein NE237_027313 [Protea cynaroides]|uniref:Uncharacterized protein n=1 Tax=Protea cynaroides TaxID=273540 RepID=A0A9Q0GMA9_9MAGN|nr:hypothetical protein NE237_027313 [Protea cynaroides]